MMTDPLTPWSERRFAFGRRVHLLAPRQRPHRQGALRTLSVAVVVVVGLAGCSSAPKDSASDASTTRPSTTTRPAANASDGCGVSPAVKGPASDGAVDVALTFESGGVARTYRLAVPQSYDADRPVPLILNLHGAGSNAIQASVYSNLPRQAAKRDVITITPDAIGGSWQLGGTGTDDDFLVAVVRDVEKNYCIDLDHVHGAGFSLGAWKTTVTACGHPDMFASIALVTVEVRVSCPPMPVIAFHGTADHTVPYGEGADPGVVVTNSNAGLPGARSNIAAWADGGHCSKDKEERHIGDDVELWTYPGCDPGIDVQLYTIHGGDHTWPGSDITIGPTTQTIDATELALDFFESHPMRRSQG